MPGRIDTHHHFLPKVYVDAIGLEDLASVIPNGVAPQWSPEIALQMMDSHGIAQGIVSISSGPTIPDAPVLLRHCNDAAAELCARYPGRFGSFASLPLPDIDASLKEITYSLDHLKADGFILFSNYGGAYLGDPHFAPVFEELNRRSAVAFIHPNHPPYHLTGLPPESLIEFPFDTTRAGVSLIFAGAARHYPNVKFILAHAGGTLPYLAQRVMGGVMMNPGLAEKIGDPMAAIRSFYYDTALSATPQQLTALTMVTDPSHILFGTDFPFAPGFAISMTTKGVDHGPFTDAVRAEVNHGNATRLLAHA